MIPAPVAYSRAGTLDEALAMLAEHGESAKLLAGGQSLIPLLKFRLAAPERLIDIGRIDEDGFVYITDRKKDLIVTAGGMNIAPQNIENLLKGDPFISQAMVHGDKRPYPVALLTLNPELPVRLAEIVHRMLRKDAETRYGTMEEVGRDLALQDVRGAEEARHRRRPRAPVDLLGRPHLLESALAHHGDAVGEDQGLFLIMGDVDRRDAQLLLEATDLAAPRTFPARAGESPRSETACRAWSARKASSSLR